MIKKWIGRVDYARGQAVSMSIPRDLAISRIVLRLSGRLRVSGGTTDGVPFVENPATLIERIRVTGIGPAGAEIVKNLVPASSHVLETLLKGTEPERVQVGATVGTHDFVQTFTINFAMPDYEHELSMSTILIAPNYETLNLEVQWRDEGSLIFGGDRALALNEHGKNTGIPYMDVEVHQLREYEIPEDIGTFPVFREGFKGNISLTEATTNLRIGLPLGHLYRGLLLKTKIDAQERPLTDAAISRFAVERAGIVERRHEWGQLRAQNKEDYHLEAMPPGYTFVDFTPTSNPEDMLDTVGMAGVGQTLDLVVEAPGTPDAKMEISLLEIIVPPEVEAEAEEEIEEGIEEIEEEGEEEGEEGEEENYE